MVSPKKNISGLIILVQLQEEILREDGKICSDYSWAETSLGSSCKRGQIILLKSLHHSFKTIALTVSVLLIKDLWEWVETDACRKKID